MEVVRATARIMAVGDEVAAMEGQQQHMPPCHPEVSSSMRYHKILGLLGFWVLGFQVAQYLTGSKTALKYQPNLHCNSHSNPLDHLLGKLNKLLWPAKYLNSFHNMHSGLE